MDDDPYYESMPDDPELAFVFLVRRFRSEFEEAASHSEGSVVAYLKQTYINQVIAAAKALDILGINEFQVPSVEAKIWDFARVFDLRVDSAVIQINISKKRELRNGSVALTAAEKVKARHYVEQIKQLVEQSTCSQEKKDAIVKKLDELLLEIDRDRTRFEIVVDKIRAVARLSGEVEREGAEPWLKWVGLFLGLIDDSKEEEQRRIPAPTERKRIEAPKKQLPTKQRDLDDEVPF